MVVSTSWSDEGVRFKCRMIVAARGDGERIFVSNGCGPKFAVVPSFVFREVGKEIESSLDSFTNCCALCRWNRSQPEPA